MIYTVLTLFPEITDAYFSTSIMAKAIQRGIIGYRAVNIRDFALDKHKTCDDAPYGGGPGMLMLADPLSRALESVKMGTELGTREQELGTREQGLGTRDSETPIPSPRSPVPNPQSPVPSPQPPIPSPQSPVPTPPRIIYLSPSGKPFDQTLARELAKERELILLCGRYEGIDQRVIDLYIDDEVSVGDYVLSSGEVAALAVIDATYRLVDRVITPESLDEESFSGGLLEYPQYTRPEIFDTMKVPDVLLSGHHENIRRWRLEQRVEKTLRNRPDLIRRGRELGLFDEEINNIIGDRT
ncbi:MAG: tRNA (guanosine(37)-N1)-methyltransferase TrmD [Treponema sp.]|jgi:tRNA (guanine37-N1)-methyltransferase|nr:tRNA (guanosine(37)-N1)-methyltransferase TrmD [Treponema sp.]